MSPEAVAPNGHCVFAVQPDDRNSKKPRAAQRIGDAAPVTALLARARALDALDRQLRQPLPESLRRQCRLATVDAARIVFLATSPTWAAKLRMHQSAILAHARMTSGLKIEKFAVKVAPLPPVPPGPTRRKPLSKASAAHLEAVARSLADPELRAIYLKLASFAE